MVVVVDQDTPPPSAFGFDPTAFPQWRPHQWDLLSQILSHPARHHLLIAPTGFGKSLLYVAAALLTEGRTVVLTSTKALQDQLEKDFAASVGLFDVRGKSAYPCTLPKVIPDMAHLVRHGTTAATAPCSWGYPCPLRDASGCPYYDRVRQARDGTLVATNYDFWLYNPDFPRVDLLVMDEAHQAPQELADWLSMSISRDARRYFNNHLPDTEEVADWIEWGKWVTETVAVKLEKYKTNPPADLVALGRSLSKFPLLEKGEWVVEHLSDGSVALDCIDPSLFGGALWGRSDRTLMVSATANSMTARALGVDDCHIWEARSAFPVERRKVWAIQGAVQVNYRMEEGQRRMWVSLIDRLLEQRPDRKGIIHTTSFERARYLSTYSRFSSRLLLNESKTTRDVVTHFKDSKSPLVLVSPSVTTGYDFPYESCEFQIIGKIPFPDMRGKANKVKAGRNRDWAGYQAAQVLVQSSGRGMRAEDDRCETLIADGSFSWWWKANKKFTPRWWQEAVEWCDVGHLPDPAPKLNRR